MTKLKFLYSPSLTPNFKQEEVLKVEFQEEVPHSTPDQDDLDASDFPSKTLSLCNLVSCDILDVILQEEKKESNSLSADHWCEISEPVKCNQY